MFENLTDPAALAAAAIVLLAAGAFLLYVWTWIRFAAPVAPPRRRDARTVRAGCAASA